MCRAYCVSMYVSPVLLCKVFGNTVNRCTRTYKHEKVKIQKSSMPKEHGSFVMNMSIAVLISVFRLSSLLDGSFFVWLEVASAARAQWSDSFVGYSALCLALPSALSFLYAFMLIWRRPWGYQKLENMPVKQPAGTAVDKEFRAAKNQVLYLLSLPGLVHLCYSVLHQAHLVGGILASLSSLGVFEGDNNHVTASNQAKWKHVLLLPLMVLCMLPHIHLIDVLPGSLGAWDLRAYLQKRPMLAYMSATRLLQSFATALAIIFAFTTVQEHPQQLDAMAGRKKQTDAGFSVGLLIWSSTCIAFSSANIVIWLKKEELHSNLAQVHVWARLLLAIVTVGILLGFQGFLGNMKSSISLVDQWNTWPLLIASSMTLIGSFQKGSDGLEPWLTGSNSSSSIVVSSIASGSTTSTQAGRNMNGIHVGGYFFVFSNQQSMESQSSKIQQQQQQQQPAFSKFTQFHVGLYFVVVLMGVLLSTVNLTGRVAVTTVLAALRVFLYAIMQ